MAARSRGNGTNFDWLRKSCDISTCDLNPDGNPEKYGRPMKSAIASWYLYVAGHCVPYIRIVCILMYAFVIPLGLLEVPDVFSWVFQVIKILLHSYALGVKFMT